MTISPLQLVALMMALGVLGIVVADTIIAIQEAEARGCPGTSPGFNKSQQRCFKGI